MIRAAAWGPMFATFVACGGDAKAVRAPSAENRSRAELDAQALGSAVFELVDRAVEYRGAHRGRPATSLRQLGIDSLTPTMVRRVVNVDREPVITVEFRRPERHEIIACRGDSQILEDAAVSGGRFMLMCTTASGAQRPIQVGDTPPQ